MENVKETRAHRNLDVWKRSMELIKAIYQITSQFPQAEQYDLVSQMLRAFISIPSNSCPACPVKFYPACPVKSGLLFNRG